MGLDMDFFELQPTKGCTSYIPHREAAFHPYPCDLDHYRKAVRDSTDTGIIAPKILSVFGDG